jgi:ArsR family transcriptional regulator
LTIFIYFAISQNTKIGIIMSEVYRALGDPTRRLILALLREGEMTAGEIADRVAVSKPTLSGHFAVLKAADLIDVTRQGTSMIYRLNLSVLEGALMALMNQFQISNQGPVRSSSGLNGGEDDDA